MVHLYAGLPSTVVMTLGANYEPTPEVPAAPGYYKIVVASRTPGYEHIINLAPGDERSPAPERYNAFLIDPAAALPGAALGQYSYKAYAMPDADTVDPTYGQLVQRGLLSIHPDTRSAYTAANNPISFRTPR